ncbi:MAG: V-type ATPase 116kDa subunit family protein [Promethearchaeota archaeon]
MKVTNEMCLFNIIIDERYQELLLIKLAELKAIHIKSKPIYQKEESTKKEDIISLRVNLDNLFKKLNIYENDFNEIRLTSKVKIDFTAKDSSELITNLLEEVYFYTNRFNELEKYISTTQIEFEKIKIINETYQLLDTINLSRNNLSKLNYFNIQAYTTFSKNLPNLKTVFEFTEFPNIIRTQVISTDRIVFFIVYPKDREKDFRERLGVVHAEEVPILKKYLNSDGINFLRVNREIDVIENTLTKYEMELKRIRDDNLPKFAAINEVVYNLEEFSWAEKQFEDLSFNRLRFRFFVPLMKKEEVKKTLYDNYGQKINVRVFNIEKRGQITEDLDTQSSSEDKSIRSGAAPKKVVKEKEEDSGAQKDIMDETPTMMKHNRIIRPFETLTRMYGIPSYSEIDPTPFLFITFPLLFGIMFGDIGHGLVLAIAGIVGSRVFKKRGGDYVNFSWIIFWCGLWAILVGFLYGEFFGTEEILGYHLMPVQIPLPFIGPITFYNPINNIMTIFIMAIFIGVFHLNLGWLLQIINLWKASKKYQAFTETLMKMLFLDGGIVLIFVWGINFNAWLTPVPPTPFPPILLPILPGILLLLFKPFGKLIGISYMKEQTYGALLGEGSMDTFETVLSVPSNVLSYTRLLALLLAHLSLMLAIEAMINILPNQESILVQVLIIIGLILGNILVILLEGILVFLNAIRLHFYEFFFKFYEGRGVDFVPLILKSDFSQISFNIDAVKDVVSKEIEKEIESEETRKEIEMAKNYISKKFF